MLYSWRKRPSWDFVCPTIGSGTVLMKKKYLPRPGIEPLQSPDWSIFRDQINTELYLEYFLDGWLSVCLTTFYHICWLCCLSYWVKHIQLKMNKIVVDTNNTVITLDFLTWRSPSIICCCVHWFSETPSKINSWWFIPHTYSMEPPLTLSFRLLFVFSSLQFFLQ